MKVFWANESYMLSAIMLLKLSTVKSFIEKLKNVGIEKRVTSTSVTRHARL